MAWKIVYTSAPRLLQAGRSGFGTVARHRDIPPLAVEAAEKSSQFSRQPGLNPARVVFAYRVVRSTAGVLHLLTRIADAGTDYSGRTNHLAQHLVLSEAEAAALAGAELTPAGVMLAYHWPAFDGPAVWFGADELWSPEAMPAKNDGDHWLSETHDAARVRLLASSEARNGAVLEYPEHYQLESDTLLWLFAESQSICPGSGWGITFTTNIQPTDDLSDFRWIAVPSDSPLLSRLLASGRACFNFSSNPPARLPAAEFVLQESADVVEFDSDEEATLPPTKSPPRPIIADPPKTFVPAKPARNWGLIAVIAVLAPVVLASIGFLFFAIGSSSSEEKVAAQTSLPQVYPASPATPQAMPTPSQRKDDPSSTDSKLGVKPSTSIEAPMLEPEKPMPPSTVENKPEDNVVRISRVFPEDAADYAWPAKTSADLVMRLIEKGGQTSEVTVPQPRGDFANPANDVQNYTDTDGRAFGLQTSGPAALPNKVRDNTPLLALLVWNKKNPEQVYKLYILSSIRSLQDAGSDVDRQELSSLFLMLEGGGLILKSGSPNFIVSNFLASFQPAGWTKDGAQVQNASFVLRASREFSKDYQEALDVASKVTALKQICQKMEKLREIELPVALDGRIQGTQWLRGLQEIDTSLDGLANPPKAPGPKEILQRFKQELKDSLTKLHDLRKTKGGDKDKPPELQTLLTPLEITPDGTSEDTTTRDMQNLLNAYFDAVKQMFPKEQRAKEYEKSAFTDLTNKKYDLAAREVKNFLNDLSQQNRTEYKAGLNTEVTSPFITTLQNFRYPDAASTPVDNSAQATKLREILRKEFPTAFENPPRPPDVAYELRAKRGDNGIYFPLLKAITLGAEPLKGKPVQ
jgi:hypothetical protein